MECGDPFIYSQARRSDGDAAMAARAEVRGGEGPLERAADCLAGRGAEEEEEEEKVMCGLLCIARDVVERA